MIIETKFNTKQKVYYVSNSKIVVGWVKVIRIECWYTANTAIEKYEIANNFNCSGQTVLKEAEELFHTSTGLAKYLVENIEGEER